MTRVPFLPALAACLLAAPADAQVVASDAADVVEVTLLPGWRDPDGTHFAALKFVLAPGWKTYWRAPGDGGVPTRLELSETVNLRHAHILWPIPQVFRENGLRSIGYRDELVLPFAFESASDGTVAIDGHLDFGVCEEICLPVHLDLNFLLPPEQKANVEEISAALLNRPTPAALSQVRRVKCNVVYADGQARISVEIDMPALKGKNEALVIETGNPSLWVSEPALERDGDTLRASAEMSSRSGTPFRLDLNQVRMTVITTQAAVDIEGCP